ncbi:hypothetical protein RJP21_18575 [Paenibacillus sp. VCA1]|uniref:hypothetical protein n=1 Tax=Paenibacillus sp. VCA1 TaxID=3039148 RepID=UPI002872577E|nr:hypothetical protein [Paenibacillus sp. VCA1]MDR9855622.1 hypothetical protein [Paenibacillus sp. VCA1]
MTCNQTELAKETNVPNVTPTNFYGIPVSGSRRFFISDNPETIRSSDFTNANTNMITLWDDTVSSQSTVKYRVFFWHLNGTSQPIKVGFTIGNGSTTDTYTVSNINTGVAITNNFLQQGKCAAAALLAGTLDGGNSNISVPKNSLKVIKEWTVNPGYLVGGVMEFDISNATNSSSALIYKIRSVAGKDTSQDLTKHQGFVVRAGTDSNGNPTKHPRGSWSFSDISGSMNTSTVQPFVYNVGSAPASVNVSNKDYDNIMKANTSYKNPSSPDYAIPYDNPGHYGVIYQVPLRFVNNTTADKTVKINLCARGGSYLGAVRANNITKIVPVISPPASGATTQESVQVVSVNVPKGATVDYTIKISNGGGANTAVAVLMSTI